MATPTAPSTLAASPNGAIRRRKNLRTTTSTALSGKNSEPSGLKLRIMLSTSDRQAGSHTEIRPVRSAQSGGPAPVTARTYHQSIREATSQTRRWSGCRRRHTQGPHHRVRPANARDDGPARTVIESRLQRSKKSRTLALNGNHRITLLTESRLHPCFAIRAPLRPRPQHPNTKSRRQPRPAHPSQLNQRHNQDHPRHPTLHTLRQMRSAILRLR